jgi:hypothetical protein
LLPMDFQFPTGASLSMQRQHLPREIKKPKSGRLIIVRANIFILFHYAAF